MPMMDNMTAHPVDELTTEGGPVAPASGTADEPSQPSAQVDADEVRGPAEVFAKLAQIVYADDSRDAALQAICDAAVVLVDGCDHASIMVRRNGKFMTAAASDDVARQIDVMERRLSDGPCLDAITEESAVLDPELADGSTWTQLATWILDNTDVRGIAGFRLISDGVKAGALNVFSDTPWALTQESVNQATVLTSFASVAIRAAEDHESALHLREGLVSNREIGKAVGLLMAFHKISDTDAFELLKSASQQMNIKLAEVAREVLEHHNSR